MRTRLHKDTEVYFDKKTNQIHFIRRAKNLKEANKLVDDHAWLDNEFVCTFEVITK